MNRHEIDDLLQSIAKGSAKRVLNCGGLLGLALLGLLMIIGVGFSIVHFNLGIFGVYAAVTALIALMGWVVYGTDQENRNNLLRRMNSSGVYIDMFDAVLFFAFWFAFFGVMEAFGEDIPAAFSVLFFPVPLVGIKLRRWLIPSTVVRFQPKNALLRTTSILCIVHSLVTFLFGASADAIDSPAHYAQIFYMIAGLLVLLAVWAHRIESRQSDATPSVPAPEA